MNTSTHIAHWLVIGPIYNPAHQSESHFPGDQHPLAEQIILDIDDEQLAPKDLTGSLDKAPEANDLANYGNGNFFDSQTYPWQILRFTGMDWDNLQDIEDNIHQHLPSGIEPTNPQHPDSFIGKHHCLVFFLTYIHSPSDRTTQLCVRSDDSIRVWLNGAEIESLQFAGDRDITPNSSESCADISLSQGWNILLVAVAETHAEWGFSARIANDADLVVTPVKPAIGDKTPALMGDRLSLNDRGGRVVNLHTDLKTLDYPIPTYDWTLDKRKLVSVKFTLTKIENKIFPLSAKKIAEKCLILRFFGEN